MNNNNSEKKERTNSEIKEITFGELIKNYKIVIPKIQRDYAQGREQEEGKAKKFLDYIKEKINSSVDLDFIYGSLKDNKFEPIDGQQRLTTVFLLYYYSTLKNGNYENFLQNFTYELRSTSKDFFTELSKEENWQKLKQELSNGIHLIEAIENSNWFFKIWRKDPTVKAVLQMLKWIEEEFENLDPKKVENNIKFRFLPLEKYNLGEDIYVKMNARGKPLTNFESFKARLFEFIEDPHEQAKFDNEYMDVFWNIAKEKTEIENAPILADRYFYALLYHVLLNLYVGMDKLSDRERLEDFIKRDPYLDFGIEVIKENNNLEEIRKFLKRLYDKLGSSINLSNLIKQDKVLKIIFEPVFKEKVDKDPQDTLREPTNYDRVRLYVAFSYFVYDFDDNYIRVLLNLVNNTRLDRNPTEDLINAIKAINKINESFISSGKSSFLEWLKENQDEISFFRKEQVKEEIRKAKLITANNQWRGPIEKAEKHWYLQGNIGFLIDFSDEDVHKFEDYYKKFETVWDLFRNNKQNQILFYRALLTFGDYMPEVGEYKTFCNFDTSIRERLDNWIRVFEDNSDNSKKQYLKQLLEKINFTDDIRKQLDNIVDNYQGDCKDWRTHFIKNPVCIEYTANYKAIKGVLGSNKLRIYIDGDINNPTRVLILSKSNTASRHVELFSWNFFSKYFKLKPISKRKEWWRLEGECVYRPFTLSYYLESSSRSIPPKIVMEGFTFEGESIKMEIYYEGKWIIILTTIDEDKSIPNKISSALSNMFEESNGKLKLKEEIKLCEKGKLNKCIQQISRLLSDLITK